MTSLLFLFIKTQKMSAAPKGNCARFYRESHDYSSTAACAAAKFSLFIRDSKGLCKLFVSQYFLIGR